MENLVQIIWISSFVSAFLLLIFYLLKAWGLYMISKKLGDEYPWIAWIPIAQIYTLVKAGGKSAWWILWIVLGLILVGILGGILWEILGGTLLPLGLIGFILFLILLGILFKIILLIILIPVLNGISKRTGRGFGTTIGLLFIPGIMFPIVGYKLKENNNKLKENNNKTVVEKQNTEENKKNIEEIF